MKLSAVDEFVGQINKDAEIDSRFAVFEPKANLNAEYLRIAIERAFPEFLRRYRTTINLQFNTLRYFTIAWHQEKQAQEYVVKAIKAVDEEIEMIEKQIEQEKELKRWYLRKMMA